MTRVWFFLLEIKFRNFWKLHCIPNFVRLSGSTYRQTTSENAVVIVITVECKRSRFLYHNKHIPSLWLYVSGLFSCGTVMFFCGSYWRVSKGHPTSTLGNICLDDGLRSRVCRIFGTFVVKFLACLPLKRSPRIFGRVFLADIFEKASFDPHNFRITRLSARKSEQMKNF